MRLKPVLPSLREKKRYIAFEILSENQLNYEDVERSMLEVSHSFLGELGCSKAGIRMMEDQYSNNKGIVKVSHKYVDHMKGVFTMIDHIKNNDVIVRSTKVSGILRKARN